MLKTRSDYWNCSRFADWIRGEKKPFALSADDWEKWHQEARSKRPLRYFLAETMLKRVQNFLMFPFDLWRNASGLWRVRFIERPYLLDTGLSRWEWHELDERIIHGLFNELKNFVEVELASMWIATDKEKRFLMKGGRCPEAGIAHLEWQCSLTYGEDMAFKKTDPDYGKPTPQAKSAKKILELYRWWEARPSRPDPMDASGWSEAYQSGNEKAKRRASDKLVQIEGEMDREDERMLVRLIKIRKSLWT